MCELGDALACFIRRGKSQPDTCAGVLRVPGLGKKSSGLPSGTAGFRVHFRGAGDASGDGKAHERNCVWEAASLLE